METVNPAEMMSSGSLRDPVSKSKIPKSTAGLYKCIHGQIHTYTGTQAHTYTVKRKSIE